MQATRRTIKKNALLVAAAGFAVYMLCALAMAAMVRQLSEAAEIGFDSVRDISCVWMLIMLGVTGLVSVLCKSDKVTWITAIGMELMGIAAALLLQSAFIVNSMPPEIIEFKLRFLRCSAIYMLIGSAAAIPLSIWLKDKRLGVQAFVIAMTGAAAVLVSYILIMRLRYGVSAITLGLMQPFVVFAFAAVSNSTTTSEEGEKAAEHKKTKYSYLEEYKRQMKQGGNKPE